MLLVDCHGWLLFHTLHACLRPLQYLNQSIFDLLALGTLAHQLSLQVFGLSSLCCADRLAHLRGRVRVVDVQMTQVSLSRLVSMVESIATMWFVVWNHISRQHSYRNRALRRGIIIRHSALLKVEVVLFLIAHNLRLFLHAVDKL